MNFRIITLNKPAELNDEQFDQRISEMGEMIILMKNIIESDTWDNHFFKLIFVSKQVQILLQA